MKLLIVAGARPNFMKISPIIKAVNELGKTDYKLVHTGQHYSNGLSQIFFEELEIPIPNVNLEVGSGDRDYQLEEIEKRMRPVIADYNPDFIIVVGDINSTLAAARAGVALNKKIAHVEAGLRSFDMNMPEEINRLETDKISHYLFVSETSGLKNLRNENVPNEKIFFVGNTMIDSLISSLEKIKEKETYKKYNLEKGSFIVSTIHRPSNVDKEKDLRNIVNIWTELQKQMSLVIPLHPRTKKHLEEYGLIEELNNLPNLVIVEPLGYLEFMNLVINSKAVITDSGGIQEETTYLKIPCITLRDNTERPSTVELGTNTLAGTNIDSVLNIFKDINEGRYKKTATIPELWDGKAGERIIKTLNNIAKEDGI